ncbi:SRPBCC family protein [Rhodococcus hoagii]|nr:SRPBCC family protein [Prescottella equi]
MGKWFERAQVPKDQVLQVSSSVEIAIPRRQVWDLIKPAESSMLLDPSVVRSFRAPGTPEGVGEIQVFISRVDGREHVGAIEVVDEVSGEYAMTRQIGDADDAARLTYLLADTPGGTRLEQRSVFTVPAAHAEYVPTYLEHYHVGIESYLHRVKLVAEGGWRAPGRHAAS